MSRMSDRRETTLNDSESERLPSTNRDSFHWPKYSLMVGTITTSAVKASESLGCHAFADVPSLRVAVERPRRDQQARVGQLLAELGLAVAVEVGRCAGGEVAGKRAPERSLGQVVEVAGLLQHLPVRQREIERNGALAGILAGARSRRRGSRRSERATACRRRSPPSARSRGCPRSSGP